MNEPSANPPSQPPRPSNGTAYWLSRAVLCVLLGLTFLDEPGVSAKVLGTVLEGVAVLIVIWVVRTKRGKRNAPTMTAQGPEPYANLQAAMAKLHEKEDKAH